MELCGVLRSPSPALQAVVAARIGQDALVKPVTLIKKRLPNRKVVAMEVEMFPGYRFVPEPMIDGIRSLPMEFQDDVRWLTRAGSELPAIIPLPRLEEVAVVPKSNVKWKVGKSGRIVNGTLAGLDYEVLRVSKQSLDIEVSSRKLRLTMTVAPAVMAVLAGEIV